MGQHISYGKHCNFRFGSYVEAHEYFNISNAMEEQIVISICLCPTATFQWRYKMFPLKKGARVYTKGENTRNLHGNLGHRLRWALTTHNGQDLSNSDEALLINQFPIKNDFYASLREGGIIGVAQDNDNQGDDDYDVD